ncbi:MAG: MDR family MFS transporter [Chloroflexota bacterium]|nr:MDR family MFS transporter [Chloroflexota bacterium]
MADDSRPPAGGAPPAAPARATPPDLPPGLFLPHRQKIFIVSAIMLSLFLAALDSTIMSVAMPRVVSDLGGLDLFAWPFTSYLLASTVIVPVVGKLSDVYGRKPFLLAGIAVFLLGSVLAGLSESMTALIGFRMVQGLGAGFIMANVFATLGDLFSPAERGRWVGAVSGTFALASVIGPLVGGALTDELSWRWVFYINVPVALVALPVVAIWMPWFRSPRKARIDYLGGAAVIAAGVPLLLGFSWAGNQYAWTDPRVVTCFLLAAAFIALFIWAERRAGDWAVLPLALFRNRVFLVSSLVTITLGFAMFGAIQFMPLFLQGAQGVSATNSGTVTMPMMIGIVVGSVAAGQLLSRGLALRPMALAGGALMVVGPLLISTLDVDSSRLLTRGYMVVMGLGVGVGLPLYGLAIQNALPHRLLGVGTASTQFFRQIGGSVGVAILGSLMASGFSRELSRAFPDGMETLMRRPQTLLDPEALERFRASVEATDPGAADAVIETARGALAGTLTELFLIGAGVMALALVIAAFLPSVRARTSAELVRDADADTPSAEPG